MLYCVYSWADVSLFLAFPKREVVPSSRLCPNRQTTSLALEVEQLHKNLFLKGGKLWSE